MATTLVSQLRFNLNTLLSGTKGLSTPMDNLIKNYVLDLANGTLAGQANEMFNVSGSLTTGAADSISMYTGNAVGDPIGGTLTLTKIKFLLVFNNGSAVGDIIELGAEGTANAWLSPFASVATAKLQVGPLGAAILFCPSLAGWAVASGSNNLLKVKNTGTNTITYDLIAIGL